MLAFVDLEERVPADHPLTHQSATDPEARLFRKGKGKEAKLVHGPCAGGEPQRPVGGLPGERSDGDGGAGCGPRALG